jgi:hypothetical protein
VSEPINVAAVKRDQCWRYPSEFNRLVVCVLGKFFGKQNVVKLDFYDVKRFDGEVFDAIHLLKGGFIYDVFDSGG